MTYTLEPPLPATPTPADYSRIHFDPCQVPAKRIVGLLACQRDPLLRSLTSTVCSATRAAAAPIAQKGRQKKKAASSSGASSATNTGANTPVQANGAETPVGTLWEVELEDTVVFPEGGGQPWDTGRLEARGQSYVIEGCVRRGLAAVHLVRSADDLGDLVGEQVTVHVDWERRTDHMVTHTAQHLLSAVLDTRGLPTLSWAMDPYPCTDGGYVEIPRGLTWAEAEEVERECNAHIARGLKVWIDVDMQGQENGDGRESRGIPKDYTGGVIRHCNIDGVDRNACCGTQCPDLSVIKFIHVLPPSTPHDATEPSSKAPTRLYFVAGQRAINHLSAASRALSRAGQAISVSRELLVERVARLESNRFETAEKEKALRLELAKSLSERPEVLPKAALVVRTQPATHDFEFMNAVAGGYFARLEEEGAQDSESTIVVVSAPPNANPALLLVQSKNQERGKLVYEDIKAALAGDDKARVKGGGARGRFMAKVDKWGGKDTAAVRSLLA